MYILINKNTTDSYCNSCEPYVICFSEDKQKLKKEIEKRWKITEEFKKAKQERMTKIREYIQQQFNEDKNKFFKIFKEKKDKYQLSQNGFDLFLQKWIEYFIIKAEKTLTKKQFLKQAKFFDISNVVKFPEHLRELKEPKEYIKSGLKEDLYIVEAKTI